MSALLSELAKITRAILPSEGVAAATALYGAVLDMKGYDGVLMEVVFGVITAGAATSIKAQQDAAIGFGTVADCEGSAQTVADTDDDKTFYIDLFRPTDRYVRLAVMRATQNAVVSSATYFQYRAKSTPVTHGTGVSGEAHASPAEGTA